MRVYKIFCNICKMSYVERFVEDIGDETPDECPKGHTDITVEGVE